MVDTVHNNASCVFACVVMEQYECIIVTHISKASKKVLLQIQLTSVTCRSTDCEATAKGRPKLREHLRSHTQEKVVACPGCGGMYANNTKLFDHIIRQKDLEGKV